jgi:methyl-accepting chemotaxis protein
MLGNRRERKSEVSADGLKAEAFRQMVEDMPINVMTCDLQEFKINYVNASSRKTLKEIEDALPVKADDLVGQCIDIFHKNPEHQRRLLSDPSNLPHTTHINVGGEVLDLLVTAIRDANGNYIGPMLTWSVITDKVKADAAQARLMQMLDNMPINVMTLDPKDFKIDYINKTSVDTLRQVESLLPVRADQVLGQCVDIFHKNPSHQRRILGDPNNLPHSAKIKLGDETLDLNVSAISSKSGEYLGPMVSWSVVTEQIRLAEKVSNVVEAVSSAATELRATAESMSASAEETSRQSTAVASAAEQATTNVQTVASAAEELSSSIAEISRQVATSNEVAKRGVDQAEQTNVTVRGLAEAADKIGEVVKLIQDIAEQTNLLALNATIEAARAGEAGKGFAVVASEVKSLANQTAKATGDIAQQIGSMQSATTSAVDAIQSITGVIGEISEIATTIASAMEEQGAATQEIARNVQEAASGTQEVSSNIGGVSQAASDTGESVNHVLQAATELSQQAETLQVEVSKFIGSEAA